MDAAYGRDGYPVPEEQVLREAVAGEQVAARCAGAAHQVDELASRLRRLPPPSWTGPAATAFEQELRRPVRGLARAAEALRRADVAARRLEVR